MGLTYAKQHIYVFPPSGPCQEGSRRPPGRPRPAIWPYIRLFNQVQRLKRLLFDQKTLFLGQFCLKCHFSRVLAGLAGPARASPGTRLDPPP